MARSVGRCRWVRWSPGSGRPALRGSRALRRRLPRAKPPARPRRQPCLNPAMQRQCPPPTPWWAPLRNCRSDPMAHLCAPPRWPAAWLANGAWTCSGSGAAALGGALWGAVYRQLPRRPLAGPIPNPNPSSIFPGGGPAKVLVLLLHGFGADHASWRPLVEQLPPEIPLAGVDLPCHGKSPVQSAGSMQAMAQAVLDRLEQEGIAACHLLGHSLGGGVALALAAAQPQRVRSLSLLAPAGLGPEINGEFIDGLTRAQTQAALTSTLALLL